MASSTSYLLVGFLVLATGAHAQNCPSSSPSGTRCYCYPQSTGYKIDCDVNYYKTSPEQMRNVITYYQSYGNIATLYVYGIGQSFFNYVGDDFLAGSQISNVIFQCSHSSSVNSMLAFSVGAFTDSQGICGLTGEINFSQCNLRQFYASAFKNCNRLEKVAFMSSHVEGLIDFPTLESLRNLTVFTPIFWTGATQRGLSRLTVVPGSSFPLLNYVDLTGNSLEDDSVQFVSQLRNAEQIYLEGNNFSTVPNLTDCFSLRQFSITLNSSSSSSILLPKPRSQTRPLLASFYSDSNAVNDVTAFDGMFVQDVVNLKLNMTMFAEEVFLDPLLQSSGLTINLNPNARIMCGCSIAWLIRDNPSLLSQIHNGNCADGRPFETYPLEDVSCCSTEPLMALIRRQRKEISDLKALLVTN
ncbi:uncharacterized protein LOC130703791 [Daphnia carinata]|uniref:uncharacterized protein LOC130703791 n=1 Tax=Daphnia carinata TaxID=120202 RepID=UPI00257A8156|nr:uncharacterized protein LOC130703791 [Daphnia carinata]